MPCSPVVHKQRSRVVSSGATIYLGLGAFNHLKNQTCSQCYGTRRKKVAVNAVGEQRPIKKSMP